MSVAAVLLAVVWTGLTLYALFAGADFGAGFWDLLAGGARRGRAERALIERVIGPVWEANHVWLIFVLVMLWTCFPPVFAAIMSTLYIPLTLAVIGIIARGSAFAFRKASARLWQQRLYGGLFALSSVVTPYFLGAAAGAVASGRVPPGLAEGNVATSWNSATSALGGVLAVGVCAYLAACYLCGDAARSAGSGRPGPELAARYRVRALATGVAVGVVSLIGLPVLRADAPDLYGELTSRAMPLVIVAVLAGVGSLVLLAARRYRVVRLTAALAVAAILWGWGVAQYPDMLPPDSAYNSVAANGTVLRAVLIVVVLGALLLVPSLGWLLVLFQRPVDDARGGPDRTPPSEPPEAAGRSGVTPGTT